MVNPLLNDKILALTRLSAFADDKVNVAKIMISPIPIVEIMISPIPIVKIMISPIPIVKIMISPIPIVKIMISPIYHCFFKFSVSGLLKFKAVW